MGLYDKNYAENSANRDYAGYEEQASSYQGRLSSLIKQTYQLLTASMIAATAGAYIGVNFFTVNSPILFFIVEIAILIALNFTAKKEMAAVSLMLLFAFTFITGVGLGPILSFYLGMGAGNIITQAFLMTAVAFGALTVYAMNTKVSFASWGKALFWALIAIIVVSLLNYFFFESPMLHVVVSGISAILFCGYILYDTQNIIRGNYTSPILAAVALYLDILNLFISLLNILGFLNRE